MRQDTKIATLPWCDTGGGVTNAWSDIPGQYATWDAVVAAEPTWADLQAATVAGRHFSFETLCGGVADWEASNAVVTLSVDDTPPPAPFAGAKSALMTWTADGAYVGMQQIQSDLTAVTAATQYRARAWVRTSPEYTAVVTLVIDWFDAEDNFLSNAGTSTDRHGEWVSVTTEAPAPAGAAKARLRVISADPCPAGTKIWADEFDLREITEEAP